MEDKGWGPSEEKVLWGHAAKSASWYMNDPLKNANFGIWMGWFFKIFQNWLKFKKIWEKSSDFA